ITTPRSPSSLGAFFAICAAARRVTLKVPIRFTSITLAKTASGIGPSLPTVFIAAPTPAQLTATWSAPNRSTARATAVATSPSLVTSAGANSVRSPISRDTSSPADPGRSRMTTWPPASTSVRTVASPRPEAPPVTRATVPAVRMGSFHTGPGASVPARLHGPPDSRESGGVRLDVNGHPLHSRALSVTLVQRGDGQLDVDGSVLDLRKRGFVPVGGDLQASGIIHDMRLRAVVDPATLRLETIAAEQPTVAFEPSPATGGESCRDPIERVEALAGTTLDAS